MSNSELFKQAIAEAKAVREAAIANAKAALEESITPHIKELLAAKLQEMDSDDLLQDDEETGSTMDAMHSREGMKHKVTEAEEKEDEGEEEEKEEGEEEKEEGDEEIDLADMDINDLKDLIRDLISAEMGEEGAEVEADAEMGAEMGVEDEKEADEEDVINLDELLAELAEMDNEGKASHKEEPAMKEGMGSMFANFKKLLQTLASKDKHLFDDDFFAKLDKATDVPALEKLAGVVNKSMAGAGGKAGSNVGGGGTGMRETSELNEAKKTIEALRKDLHEVNLLNSKLLYVNKIFKAKNLSEGEKVNVITAFDKATTVKETKLVYETLSEQFTKAAKKSVNEVKGFASKPVGAVTAQKQIISEDATVKRLQKLAGIIK